MSDKETTLVSKVIAEFFGTFFLTSFIIGSVANQSVGGSADLLLVSLTHGLALTFCAALFGGISGGHVNPAVSLAFLLKRKINALEFIAYVIAQVFGGVLAGLVVFFLYYDSLSTTTCTESVTENNSTSIKPACIGVFTTSGASGATNLYSAFAAEAIGTFVLLCAVLATADKRNTSLNGNSMASFFVLFAGITVVGTSFGRLTGFAINPARDLGPRIWTMVVYGAEAFNAAYFWIPIAGPFAGAAAAVPVYECMMGFRANPFGTDW